MHKLIERINGRGGLILLVLAVTVAIVYELFLKSASHHGGHRPATLFPLAGEVQSGGTPSGSPAASQPAESSDTTELNARMDTIVKAFYRLTPQETTAELTDSLRPLLPPAVLKQVTPLLQVGTTSVADQIRISKQLTETATADFTHETVTKVDAAGTVLYIIVPVTDQQYLPQPPGSPPGTLGAKYVSNDSRAPSVETFNVGFTWRKAGGTWQLQFMGDPRSASSGSTP